MVSFRRTPRPRNYLSRREQWRLLVLVLSLGLVFILMNEARKPKNWHWLTSAGDGPEESRAGSAEEGPIDTRLQRTRAQDEIPGTFVSPAADPPQAPEDSGDRYFPGVKPKNLASICDDEPFRHHERYEWFNLLDILNRTREPALRSKSLGRITFAQLFKQSKDYRGQLVTIRGTVRRANPLRPATNDVGITRLYRTWVFPDDNPSSPIVVYCLKLPEGFPAGMTLVEEAEITGFFFKRWPYNAWDPERKETTLRTAPVMVARTLHWYQPPVPVEEPPATLGAVLTIVGVALALSFLAAAYVYTRTRSPRREPSAAPDLDVLRRADAGSDFRPPSEEADDQGQRRDRPPPG